MVHHIYEKRNKTDPCFIYSDKHFNTFFQKDGNNFFILVPHVLKELVKFMVGGLIESDTYVETNLVVYESVRTLMAKKNLEINKKKAVEKHFGLWTEHGCQEKYLRNMPNFFGNGAGKDDFVHYNSLGEYLDKNTMATGLAFDKLDYLFRIYFALVIAILLANTAHYWTRKLARCQIPIWFLAIFLYLKNKTQVILRKFRFF